MSSISSIVNKSLRRVVCPVLRDSGFTNVTARAAWAWTDSCVSVFKVRAVGAYFSDVTGWPPGSVGVEMGVHFRFVPSLAQVKRDKKTGLPLPAEHQCHLRHALDRTAPQLDRVSRLENAAERERRDLWWVDRDGSNADDVASDISRSLVEHGLPWLGRATDPERALEMILGEWDCYDKYARAVWLAKHTGNRAVLEEYESKTKAEAVRIGQDENKYLIDVPWV